MVCEQFPDCVFFEQATLQRAPVHQHTLHVIQLRPRQPVSPRGGEPHLLPVHNRAGENIFDSRLQNRFSGQAFDGIFRWNAGAELHQHVIEKRNPALGRRGHAHLILLHQQFHQVGLNIRVQQAVQQVAGRSLPIMHGSSVSVA